MSELTDGLTGIGSKIGELISDNPLAAVAGAGVVGAGVGAGIVALAGKKSKGKARKSATKRKRKKITHTSRGLKQDRKRKSRQPWEVAYRRRKKKKKGSKKARRGIHYTKKGQPYKILSSGKARFIKKTRRK